MEELTKEIKDLLDKPVQGYDWAKTLFWDLLEFDRIVMPIPGDILNQSECSGIGESILWAESCGIHVVMFRCSRGKWQPDLLRRVAGTVALVWRRSLLLFGDAAGVDWSLVVCVPRTEGRAGECRTLSISANGRLGDLPRLLAGLSPATGSSTEQALNRLWLAADPLTDSTEAVMYGLPQWLRSQLAGSSFEDFVRRVGTHANLTKLEEQELGMRIRAQDRDAWTALVCHNIRLAIWGACRFARSRLEFEDLVQHSLLGVMAAADRFDPSMQSRFSTYAFHWMRQHCQRACEVEATLIRIPSHHHRGLRAYRKRIMRDGVNREILSADNEYENILRLMSLESHDWRKNGVYGEASLEQDPAIILEKDATRKDLSNEIKLILSQSSARDREAVCRRFGLERHQEATLEEIGVSLGITRERVRQIESKQLQKIWEGIVKKFPELSTARRKNVDDPHSVD